MREFDATLKPNSGLDTLSLETRAERKGDNYLINGAKMQASSLFSFISLSNGNNTLAGYRNISSCSMLS